MIKPLISCLSSPRPQPYRPQVYRPRMGLHVYLDSSLISWFWMCTQSDWSETEGWAKVRVVSLVTVECTRLHLWCPVNSNWKSNTVGVFDSKRSSVYWKVPSHVSMWPTCLGLIYGDDLRCCHCFIYVQRNCTFDFYLQFGVMAFVYSVKTPARCVSVWPAWWPQVVHVQLFRPVLRHTEPKKQVTDHFHFNKKYTVVANNSVCWCSCEPLGFLVIRFSHCSHALPKQRHVPACSRAASGQDDPKLVLQASLF